MASVPGSFLIFDKPAGDARPINLVLTPDGTGATTLAGAFNIEIFTSTAGAAGKGFDASAFVQGAVQNLPTEVRAGSVISTEQMLTGAFQITDVTGGETIMGGSAANQTVYGASADTIIGGSADGFIVNAITGKQTIIQGTGANAALFGGTGDIILPSTTAAPGTASGQIVGAANMQIGVNAAGNYTITSGTGTTITGAGSAANVDIIGSKGDLINLTGLTGNASLTGANGGDTLIGGNGTNLFIGATGDSIVGAGTSQIIALASGETIVAGAAGAETVNSGGGNVMKANAGNATLAIAPGKGDIINLTGNTGSVGINATVNGATNATITAGSGSTTLIGAAGDSLIGGSGGTEQVLANLATGISVVVGSGGAETIASGGGNTFTALAGNASALIAGGAKDKINLTGNTGAETLILGAGSVVTVGNGPVQVAGEAGTSTIVLSATGNSTLTGAAIGTTGSGDSITATGSGGLIFNLGNPGVGGINTGRDYIDLSKSSGSNVLNAFSNGATLPSSTVEYTTVNDTIVAGTGSNSVFGGPGDSIGVGTSTSAGGSHLWDHSTSIAGASMKFGTDDSVASSSSASVTVTNFQAGTDLLFYQNENKSTSDNIVAVSSPTTVGGQASVLLHLPDGTSMTLVGVTQASINTANLGGKLFG